MQAAILIGGLGTRLGALTERLPKAMVLVNGRPFLIYLLELLREQGVDDIVMCIGYRGEQIMDFVGDGQSLGLKVRYSREEGELLGTGGALKQAQPLLDEYFFVINGDTYLPIDYSKIQHTLLQRSELAIMVVYDNEDFTGVRHNVRIDEDSMVVAYDKESSAIDLKFTEAGVLFCWREVLDFMEAGRTFSLEKGFYSTLIQQRELAAYVTKQRFYDIGTPEQLKVFERFLQMGTE